jgi:hypothetical protein
MNSSVVLNGIYVILGASGNTTQNTTPTSFERFVQDVVTAASHAKAPSA